MHAVPTSLSMMSTSISAITVLGTPAEFYSWVCNFSLLCAASVLTIEIKPVMLVLEQCIYGWPL